MKKKTQKTPIDTNSIHKGLIDSYKVDDKNLKGVFKSAPDRADLGTEINENLIIELYSK